jgi:hypothetical protein
MAGHPAQFRRSADRCRVTPGGRCDRGCRGDATADHNSPVTSRRHHAYPHDLTAMAAPCGPAATPGLARSAATKRSWRPVAPKSARPHRRAPGVAVAMLTSAARVPTCPPYDDLHSPRVGFAPALSRPEARLRRQRPGSTSSRRRHGQRGRQSASHLVTCMSRGDRKGGRRPSPALSRALPSDVAARDPPPSMSSSFAFRSRSITAMCSASIGSQRRGGHDDTTPKIAARSPDRPVAPRRVLDVLEVGATWGGVPATSLSPTSSPGPGGAGLTPLVTSLGQPYRGHDNPFVVHRSTAGCARTRCAGQGLGCKC